MFLIYPWKLYPSHNRFTPVSGCLSTWRKCGGVHDNFRCSPTSGVIDALATGAPLSSAIFNLRSPDRTSRMASVLALNQLDLTFMQYKLCWCDSVLRDFEGGFASSIPEFYAFGSVPADPCASSLEATLRWMEDGEQVHDRTKGRCSWLNLCHCLLKRRLSMAWQSMALLRGTQIQNGHADSMPGSSSCIVLHPSV